VAAVFLDEPERAVLEANDRQRDRGYRALQREAKETILGLQHAQGRWLSEEARRAGLPVLAARPWTTLADRILAAVGEPDPRLA
jgi:hypothetical protein